MAPRNPFRPSFGITPTVVVGRELVTMNVGLALLEGPGSPYGFTLVSGPRGSGKTVLLNLLEEEARYRGWTVLRVTSSHDMVDDLVAKDIPALLRDITGKKTRRIVTGGSVAGIGSATTQAESAFPVRESLRTLLHSLVTTLDDRDSGLIITVDEIHAARPADLHRLTDAIQNLVRDGLPVAMSVAGLPYEISALLDRPGTTFLRRACAVQLGTLRDAEVADALRKTADDGGRPFTEDALTAATDYCHGYAYLIQLLGSVSWTFSTGGRITTEDVAAALPFTRERENGAPGPCPCPPGDPGTRAGVPPVGRTPRDSGADRRNRRAHGNRRKSGLHLPSAAHRPWSDLPCRPRSRGYRGPLPRRIPPRSRRRLIPSGSPPPLPGSPYRTLAVSIRDGAA